ncbi:7230_t:CDS:1, partial [Racocetra fulgida]
MSSNTESNPRDGNKELRTILQPAPTTPAPATISDGSTTELRIDPSTKAYIDEAIRASTTTIIGSIRQYIDAQNDKQKLWNEQLQANINNIIVQITQTNANTNATAPGGSTTPAVYTMLPQQSQKSTSPTNNPPTNKGKETSQPAGKYPPAPVLNDLIMRASKVSLQGQD